MLEGCEVKEFFLFFFSSRRRHTRYIGDWSSCALPIYPKPAIKTNPESIEDLRALEKQVQVVVAKVSPSVENGRASSRGRGAVTGGVLTDEKKNVEKR